MRKLKTIILLPIAIFLIVVAVIMFATLIVVTLPFTVWTERKEPGYATRWATKMCEKVFSAGMEVGNWSDD